MCCSCYRDGSWAHVLSAQRHERKLLVFVLDFYSLRQLFCFFDLCFCVDCNNLPCFAMMLISRVMSYIYEEKSR